MKTLRAVRGFLAERNRFEEQPVSGDPVYFALRRARNEGDVETLVQALDDQTDVFTAVRFLGQMEAVEAAPRIVPLLNSPYPYTRSAAADALGELGHAPARGALRSMAQEDEVTFVRASAVTALGRIGDPDDLELLVSLLDSPLYRVRWSAVKGLGEMRDERGLEPLRRMRHRMWRSPGEWFMYRTVLQDAIDRTKGLRGRPEDEPTY